MACFSPMGGVLFANLRVKAEAALSAGTPQASVLLQSRPKLWVDFPQQKR